MPRVADIAAATLHAHGVRRAFGMPGGEVMTFIDALETAGIRFVLARHETAAGFMAAANAVAANAPGLLVTTVGPGLANGLNAIADAAQEHVPLLVVSGVVDHDLRHLYTHQVFDQSALVRPLVKGTFEIEADTAGPTVARAIRLATTSPMGPVHLDLAPGTAARNADEYDRVVTPARLVTPDVRLDQGTLNRGTLSAAAINAITDTRRPLIMAGREAVDAAAGAALLDLAETLNAPVITTYKAKGIIPEHHPLALCGAGLSPKADAILRGLLRATDLVVLAGYDPIEMRPGWFDPFSHQAFRLDLSQAPSDHGMHDADERVVAPVAGTLAALNAIARSAASGPSPSPRETWMNGELAAARTQLADAFKATDAWGPHAVFAAIQDDLTPKTTITVDSGAHRILLSQMLKLQRPRQLQQSAGFCTMGTALPSALGIALTDPDQHVIAVLGDGGLEMGLGELATVRDTGAKIAIVVLQDESLALIELKQAKSGLTPHGVRLGRSPFEDIARSFGGHGVRVSSRPALQDALATARSASTFTLIVCEVEANAYVDSI